MMIPSVLLVMILGGWYLNNLEKASFEQRVRDNAELISAFSASSCEYFKKELLPALQDVTDEYIVEGMSAAYMTTAIMDRLNEHMPGYTYHQPTTNPLNLQSKADDFEQSIIDTFNAQPELEEFSGYQTGQFYIAKPIVSESSCLECHGAPENAPIEIQTLYGIEHGYNWPVGEVVGAMMIRVPADQLQNAMATRVRVIALVFILLSIIIIAISYVIFGRLVTTPISCISNELSMIASKPDASLCLKGAVPGEFQTLTFTFNEMATQISNHTREIEKQVQERTSELNEEVTKHKTTAQQLRKLNTAVEQNPTIIMITDLEGNLEYVNPSFTRVSGYTKEEALGANPRILKSGERSQDSYREMWKTITAGGLWQGEFHNKKRNGDTYWVSAVVSGIRDEDEVITHYLAVEEDITERKLQDVFLEEARTSAEREASTDKLTGLPNRMIFLDRVEEAIKRGMRHGNRFAVLFFDFDRFKVVNDSLGHSVGDALLCNIAALFRQELRQTDTAARFGGDEFVVLLDGLEQWSDAALKAGRLLAVFAAPHDLNGHSVTSTASIGLVTNEHAYETADKMIRDADTAMYQAKDAGRGRVVVFDENMHKQAVHRLALEDDLRSALKNNELRVKFQPILELESGKITGFEALARWVHPDRGLISPVEFIPIAEETGLIIDIGDWVLREACRHLADWNTRLGLDNRLSVNVNVSKRQLLDTDLINNIIRCVDDFDLHPSDLKLEITETVIVDDRSNIKQVLAQLRERGFQIAMDDFGTGLSSLSMLHEFPIDILKIDQSFIRAMDGERSLLAVVASITTLADNLGIETVAEGIERIQTIGALQSIGCTYGQGFLFAKPMSPEVVEKYLLGTLDEKRIA